MAYSQYTLVDIFYFANRHNYYTSIQLNQLFFIKILKKPLDKKLNITVNLLKLYKGANFADYPG